MSLVLVRKELTLKSWKWLKGRTDKNASVIPTINVEVKTSTSQCPMDRTEIITFSTSFRSIPYVSWRSSWLLIGDQPENYTTAVIVWNIMKDPRNSLNRLGPCLRLYEARNASKWFPMAGDSTPIKNLFKTPKQAPCLYAVNEDAEYVVATLVTKPKEPDPESDDQKKGVVLSMCYLLDSDSDSSVHAMPLSFRTR